MNDLSKHLKPAPKKFYCEIEDYKEHQDSGCWRSYSIQAEGDTLDELLDDCHIFETDQDGGELRDYKDCGPKEEIAIRDWFEDEIERIKNLDVSDWKPIVDPPDEG